jgi:LCP family protein required for cell wall assembly
MTLTRAERRRTPSRRGFLCALVRRFSIALLIGVIATAGALLGVNKLIDVKLATAKRVHVRTAVASSGPINFLVLGADIQAEDQLSDTMWVIRVDPARRTALVVSFPRDLWVQIPGHGMEKINASNNGGPQLVIDTMKADFGVPISHYVQVDYASFKGVVNAIGTVPVYVPYPARDQIAGFYAPIAGCKQFTGYDALQYVRSRTLSYYSYLKGAWLTADAVPDIDRIARQQDFVRRLATLAAAKGRANPITANSIADRVLENLTVDSGLSKDDVLTLVDTFIGISPNDPRHVTFETFPSAEGPNQQGQSVLYVREPDADAVIASLGGTGIGANPSVGGSASSSPSTSPATSPSGSGTGSTTSTTAPSTLHASIANQSALGAPAPRVAPC